MLILAFDTATTVATAALVDGETVLGERTASPLRVLEEIDGLLRDAGIEPSGLEGIAVGLGPGSFTGVRTGLAAARGLSLALDIPVAGVPTLDALEAGAPDAVALIDAKRREVFLRRDGSFVAHPAAGFEAPGRTCIGDGAVRYREHLEATGAIVPPDESGLHLPRARFHARLAHDYGTPDLLQPIYVRAPDADRMFA